MGQGLYNLLGYGCFDPPMIEDKDGYSAFPDEIDDLIFINNSLNLETSYECEPSFLCIGLAVDDEFLQEHRKLKALPTNILRCAPRKARYLEDNIEYKIPNRVKFNWKRLQQRFKKYNLELPDARLIVVNDWD